jgi:hypothetical protein
LYSGLPGPINQYVLYGPYQAVSLLRRSNFYPADYLPEPPEV